MIDRPSRRGAILSEAAARAPNFRDGICRISDTQRQPPAVSRKPAENLVSRGGLAGLPAPRMRGWRSSLRQRGTGAGADNPAVAGGGRRPYGLIDLVLRDARLRSLLSMRSRSEEHRLESQQLMRTPYAASCL